MIYTGIPDGLSNEEAKEIATDIIVKERLNETMAHVIKYIYLLLPM
jgi:hypothetical protein